jgi:hypothetical protein
VAAAETAASGRRSAEAEGEVGCVSASAAASATDAGDAAHERGGRGGRRSHLHRRRCAGGRRALRRQYQMASAMTDTRLKPEVWARPMRRVDVARRRVQFALSAIPMRH